MDQGWFEMADLRRRSLAKAVWLPLRAAHQIERKGKYGYVGFRDEFYGVGSLAVPVGNKAEALQLGWSSIGISQSHAGHSDDGKYLPADVYESHGGTFLGLHLVLDQRGVGSEPSVWHLHQDFVIALGLKREGDSWLRPEEDYLEVARLVRAASGSNARLEVRSLHLRDYLCARGLGLVMTSYRRRSEVFQDASHISWQSDRLEDTTEFDRWFGGKMAIHEGGREYGGEVAVFHVVRTDVDPEDDVPVLSPPSDGNLDSQSWTTKFEGEKLYRVWGEMWRTDWIDPASASPIVRGEKVSPTVAFIIDAQGNRALADMLVDSGRWLWFKPTVISALINRRGGSLTWYTKETGGVAAFPGQKVHFGLNSIGLVNVYAKDVAFLPEWQQRVWAAHNVGPDGKLSEELQASQVYADPARTQAPEAFLEKGLNALQASGKEKLGISILRKHAFVAELLPRIHRFRANDREGLFALAKDVARITADDIDEKVLQAIVGPPKGERWASLKSLEKVLAQKVEADQARRMLSALAGIYDLRLADAHLPSNKAQHAIQSIGIDETLPYVKQGFQLLDAAVGTIYWIAKTIERMW